MKLDSALPEEQNGWLIAGANTLYGNSPMIYLKLIKYVTYYEYKMPNTPSQVEIESEKKWYIDFDGSSWYYGSREEMDDDYREIAKILIGDKITPKKKERKTI